MHKIASLICALVLNFGFASIASAYPRDQPNAPAQGTSTDTATTPGGVNLAGVLDSADFITRKRVVDAIINSYQTKLNPAQAEALVRSEVEFWRKKVGDDDLRLALQYATLESILRRNGKTIEAEAARKQRDEIVAKDTNRKHKQWSVMQERAQALKFAKDGDLSRAEQALQTAVSKARELPPGNRELPAALVDLGRVQQEQNQTLKAAESYAEAIELVDKYGEDVRDFRLTIMDGGGFSYGGSLAFYGFHVRQILPLCEKLFAEAGKPGKTPTVKAALLETFSEPTTSLKPGVPPVVQPWTVMNKSKFHALVNRTEQEALATLPAFADHELKGINYWEIQVLHPEKRPTTSPAFRESVGVPPKDSGLDKYRRDYAREDLQ